MDAPYRVACLTTHPIQYQAPLFRYLARDPAIDLTVLFLSGFSAREHRDPGFGVSFKWDVPLLDGYHYEFLGGSGAHGGISFWRPLTRGIRRALGAGRFDALWVRGYAHQAHLRALAAARSFGIKVMMRGESHLGSESRNPVTRAIKRRILPRLFGHIDAFLPIGALNREYYLHYGAPAERMFAMPYAVDNAFFRSRAEQARAHREELRAELGFEPGRPVILAASKLQPKKRARDLLEAYGRLSSGGGCEPQPCLLFVGDGGERPALEARVRELGLRSVRFAGFRNQTELPRYYDLCDVFVLPSESEPWGLAVNEVMNAAKPVIVSDQVGAGPDLVADGENGFVYPVGDTQALAERLQMLTSSREHAAAMGQRSLKRIEKFSFEADRRGLLDALESLFARRTLGFRN